MANKRITAFFMREYEQYVALGETEMPQAVSTNSFANILQHVGGAFSSFRQELEGFLFRNLKKQFADQFWHRHKASIEPESRSVDTRHAFYLV